MTTENLDSACGFTAAVRSDARMITGIYSGDLLSWVMGRAKAGDAWCTVMGNVNAVAVATLADCACIVLCQDAVLDDVAKERATQQGVTIFTTSMPEFEAGMAIAKAIQPA
ncbi:MAG: hypothetical protein RR415_01060 [Ruthenibacterium sp.]